MSNYNFLDLEPAAQHFLFRKVCEFEVAANTLATIKYQNIFVARKHLLLESHLYLQENSLGSRIISIFLSNSAVEAGLPQNSLAGLTPESQHHAWVWHKATALAAQDKILQFCTKQFFGQLRDQFIRESHEAIAGSTPEEIYLYWKNIDSWESSEDYFESPILQEVA